MQDLQAFGSPKELEACPESQLKSGTKEQANCKRVSWKIHALNLNEGRISQKHMHVFGNLVERPGWASKLEMSLGLHVRSRCLHDQACLKGLDVSFQF